MEFVANLPDGWEDQSSYFFGGPEEDGVQHSLVLVVDRHLRHDSIESFANEKTAPIVESMPDIEVLKDEKTTIPGGNQAHEFVYKWMPSEDTVTIVKYVFVIKDDLGFTFSTAFSRKSYKTVGLQLPQIIESLVPGTYEPLANE